MITVFFNLMALVPQTTSVKYLLPLFLYLNTTSAVDAVQFKMNTGNIDAGTIKMYGVK